ncbi:MAG: chromosome segregation protein SMC [Alphaproteobacteria bacterium]|nr:chromosome segregation protein SMC [Alphaproteobacteria bacterium]
MKVTRLRLSGFKSFCDATELPIEPGLTGIVGPNGCGKSNLVEALRWVMGENSPKRMRGSGMEDVIFAGASARPARNYAEVSLTLENNDRRAPAGFNEATELEVARRIARELGSTYRFNGQEVRARDVQTFFADIASGPHSTAFVRQGQIGQLINAKPVERRMVLEEAAGIAGLHARRHEAELKLKAAEANLARVEDVVQQIEAQLSGLKRQARQATRYRRLSEQIARLEALVLHARWAEAGAAALEAEASLRTLERDGAEATLRLSQAAAAEDESQAALTPLRAADAEAAARHQRLGLERERLEESGRRAQAEIARLEADLRTAFEDLNRERTFLADGESVLTRLAEEERALHAAEEGAAEPLTRGEEAAMAARARLAAAEHALDNARDALARARADEQAARARLAELSARATRLAERLAAREAELATAGADREAEALSLAARAEVESAERLVEERAGTVRGAETAREAAETDERTARGPLSEADRQVARLKAEAEALVALLKLEAGALWPPVVDQLTVAPGFEAALGAALGDDLNASTDEAAPLHWRTLPPGAPFPPLPEGAVPLSALVDAPTALDRRLSQVGVVEDGQGGFLQARLKPGQRLVSRRGDLWRWDGFAVSAEAPTPAAQRLAQRNRLKELEQALPNAEAAARAARDGHDAARRAGEATLLAEREARAALRAAEGELARARAKLGAAERAAAGARERLSGLTAELQHLRAEQSDVSEALSAAEGTLGRLPDGEALKAAAEAAQLETAEARAASSAAQVALDTLKRDGEMRRSRQQAIAEETRAWKERIERALAQSARLTERAGGLKGALERARAVPDEIAANLRSLGETFAEAEAARREAGDRLAEGEAAHRAAREAHRAAEAAAHEIGLARAREEATLQGHRQRLAESAERIREAFDCAPEEALSKAGIESLDGLPELSEIEGQLDRFRRDREALGAVNLRAEIEAEECETRLNELNAERHDLEEAIDRLRQAISSLNKEGRERLSEAFEAVRAHFEQLFTRLFNGGAAELKLTEADDPLQAGLEIFARPPGKRLQTMSLLSGGEQALTAMSLIFAVFLTNPAPICVLDEVDAPLDDANVDRFCNLLDEMRRLTETRFLVITHHPLTMSRLDRLFGVTMAERGVSQLVSVDLADAERVALAG